LEHHKARLEIVKSKRAFVTGGLYLIEDQVVKEDGEFLAQKKKSYMN
jgi:hypothetical protein